MAEGEETKRGPAKAATCTNAVDAACGTRSEPIRANGISMPWFNALQIHPADRSPIN
jgi:hypothetical protein